MAITTAARSRAESPRSWFDRLWSSIADRGRDYVTVPAPSVPPLERARQLSQALLSERGEASGAAVSRELLLGLRSFGSGDRLAFMQFLAERFAPDPASLRRAAEAYLEAPDVQRAMTLFAAAEPPRQELLRRMNMAPGGTSALVGLRQELLGLMRKHPDLAALEADLKHLLASWFNRGFLELRRIDWRTPAVVLEKLIAYEAVHEIRGWDDLRRRLAPDRRCFGFFHPALPDEPLIFVEVALVDGLASAIEPLLGADAGPDEEARARAGAADTAIFYSISNCQEGLRGISFGNFLIKQVVEELKSELPSLACFATLSPVPGFRRWAERRFQRAEGEIGAANPGADIDPQLLDAEWWLDAGRAEALRAPLLRLCAEYLTRPNKGIGGIDPVARFHLGNGARLERINWLGNRAARGMQESFGIMVNYLYDPNQIEANHQNFVATGAVTRSATVDALRNEQTPKAESPRRLLGRRRIRLG